jgi:hypothetical protein
MSAISIGCWTCRVRHKKCDITTPFCRECSDRNVHCHGYGPKPAWMDGASEEKKERARIKLAINQHVRRVRKMQNRAKRGTSPPQGVKEMQPADSQVNASTALDTGDSNLVQDTSLESVDRPSSQDGIFDPQAACLLMHYLDQVFPWQFPYFRSTSRLGNRGWLLYLLMKRGPLYHAVLSLSSLHQSAILGSEEEYQQKERALEHHSRALREFCKFMSEERGKLLDDNARLAEFLACSLILISCEVWTWRSFNHLSTHEESRFLEALNTTGYYIWMLSYVSYIHYRLRLYLTLATDLMRVLLFYHTIAQRRVLSSFSPQWFHLIFSPVSRRDGYHGFCISNGSVHLKYKSQIY